MKTKHLYNSVEYESAEELEFACWLEEGEKANLISGVKYQPVIFELLPKHTWTEQIKLKTKIKTVTRTLLQGHSYKPDWVFYITPLFSRTFVNTFMVEAGPADADKKVWVDVKGTYNTHDTYRRFSIEQKLVYYRLEIYVHRIVLPKLFAKTWVPEKCAFDKRIKKLTLRKPYKNCKLLKEVDFVIHSAE